MEIRTYYWYSRIYKRYQLIIKRLQGKSTSNCFLNGNAGDIITKDIISKRYGCDSSNIHNSGNRLLVTGSIAHNIMDGDVICGVGTKGKNIPKYKRNLKIIGVRGPITSEVFKSAGYDVSHIKFNLDPGLLIRFFGILDVDVEPRGKIFIPHYRERNYYRNKLPSNIRFVDIDNTPKRLAMEIKKSEIVYSSSLHGLIFSHALERPCVFVKPLTDEPILKFQDYYASVNIPFPNPLCSIPKSLTPTASLSPADFNYSKSDFTFPDIKELISRGIAT